ncbi:MAG: heme-binding domain-containing protein, partial [Tepidisphaeraceae bacterium]
DTVGCIKCHTLDRHEDPRGPFLGDAGGKFDAKHLIESILNPSAKIAQGFATENIVTKEGEFTGFVTRDTSDEVQLRDLTGKVTSVSKPAITKRTPLPGSMMPQGLIDTLSLDDFSSLIAFLESMK